MVEYWLETIERIMEDLDCSSKQKLKGAMSLLREETYQWWLAVKEGNQLERVTWEFFKTTFQGKYVGASYMDARRKEFLNLTQGNKLVSEYEAEFLRLSRYSRVMVETDYEHCVRFEDGLRDSFKVLIAPQRERVFTKLLEKAKIVEEREAETPGVGQRPRARDRNKGPVRAGPPAINPGVAPCADYGRRCRGECWKRMGACFAGGSMEHRIKDCPRMLGQEPIVGQGGAQPPRGGQLPPRGHGQARGGNGNGRGRGAPGKNTGHVEAKQPALVYAARR
ncbi:uncharacterized protein [Gossypium hirsutum]|uniref:Retrotransposon gag domain-containing protein n=1 Tax=Gossypium hirsutum TaxID=3635 RepID=A0ABM3BLK7_GOSHI|nr:uncharacterized protein LOC121228966 [Gossypium hirsutum]